MNLRTTWNRCLLASLTINGLAIGALGAGHLAEIAPAGAKRIAKAAPKPKTRLMELRLEKEAPQEEPAADDGASGPDQPGGSEDADEAARRAVAAGSVPAPGTPAPAKLSSHPGNRSSQKTLDAG